MNEARIARFIVRYRPPRGWLAFLLLLGALGVLAFSVLEVNWVPNDAIVVPAIFLGFLLAARLAFGRTRPWPAIAILIAAGLALGLLLAAEMTPPPRVVAEGPATLADFWRIRAALFVDRAAGWLAAVRGGGRSTETVVFALFLGLAGWAVGALLGWSAYRLRRPYLGLTLAGVALVANTFYGRAGLYWAVFFFGLAITAGTYLTYLYREIEWEEAGTDYSAEVRSDLLVYAAGISLGIMSLAMAIPAINFRAIAAAFQSRDAVIAAEQTLARAFAGVAQPRQDEGAGGGGGMPRAFLLGGGPELAATVVMTATTSADPPADLAPFHWRSVSFDIYTGRGWQRSPEREADIDAGQPIPAPDETPAGVIIHVNQTVNWLYDHRATRYTLGRPLLFSHDLVVMWRGTNDLVGVRGRNNAPRRYAAETTLIAATPDGLRAARPQDAPPEIRARYTQLPRDLPARVHQLAQQIAGAQPTAYDQARAIEAFLRQYPYSLDLNPPPADVDIVDYFLFDLQTGFCDYYASAMVVMARAVGLPARLGVGFLQRPADANGVQSIRQIDAHSWAEIYFPGYGWVEFEPTASAAAAPNAPAPAATAGPAPTYDPFGGAPVAIPDRAPQRETPWLLLLGLVAAALVGWRLWGRRLAARLGGPGPGLDETQLAFARLQRRAADLGHRPQSSQTPAEFAATLLADPLFDRPDGAALRPSIERLTALFIGRQYGRAAGAAGAAEARDLWGHLGGSLRRLALRRRLQPGREAKRDAESAEK